MNSRLDIGNEADKYHSLSEAADKQRVELFLDDCY